MSKAAGNIEVRAPARVNLIGEHTDYNGGYVLPAALNLAVTASGSPRDDNIVSVCAADIGEKAEFTLDRIEFESSSFWLNYVKGVAFYLLEAGAGLKGSDILIKGDIPSGAGLSSSAALEVASALFMQKISGFEMSPVDTAKLCQRAENEFVGMSCGLMDQFACCMGKKDHAVFLDCRTLAFEHVPLSPGLKIAVCNTGIRRGLASSEYNKRRAECERAAELLGVEELSRAAPERIDELPLVLQKRARHVLMENERVLKSVSALKEGRFEELRGLFAASHASLRDDFQVSCPELDLMVELAMKVPGVYGARLTGAGFGGCAVSLLPAEYSNKFTDYVGGAYHEATGIRPEIYLCSPADGAGIRVRS